MMRWTASGQKRRRGNIDAGNSLAPEKGLMTPLGSFFQGPALQLEQHQKGFVYLEAFTC